MRKMHVGGGALRGYLQGLFMDSGIQEPLSDSGWRSWNLFKLLIFHIPVTVHHSVQSFFGLPNSLCTLYISDIW